MVTPARAARASISPCSGRAPRRLAIWCASRSARPARGRSRCSSSVASASRRSAYARGLFADESAYVAIDVEHAESVPRRGGGQNRAPVDVGVVEQPAKVRHIGVQAGACLLVGPFPPHRVDQRVAAHHSIPADHEHRQHRTLLTRPQRHRNAADGQFQRAQHPETDLVRTHDVIVPASKWPPGVLRYQSSPTRRVRNRDRCGQRRYGPCPTPA